MINRRYMILAIIGVIFASLLFIMTTYAYFTVEVEGEGEDIILQTFNENNNIVYTDTSNLSLVNSYTGDEIVKTFTIENTSDYLLYYDIKLNNVANNFANNDDLVYTLESNNGASRSQTIVPSQDEPIASYIRINKNEKHEYTLKITFLKTDKDQSNNMNKTFSSNIIITPSRNINVGDELFDKKTLGYHISSNSLGSYNESKEEGIYKTNSSINGTTVYFYRGSNNLKNNLVFNNNCYKIIRTTSDFSTRIIYNGKYENNTCSDSVILDDLSVYNNKSNYNSYVGYMYGDASSNNYVSEHANKNSSNIKSKLENWYQENFNNKKDYISFNSFFCNNRKTTEFTLNNVLYGTLGYGNNNTGYDGYTNNYPSYDCYLNNDKLSTNNGLIYPVGLITIDELKLAGFNDFENNFLYSNDSYYTMSPAYFNGSDAYLFIVDKNKILESKVSSELGLRPVLNLNKDVIIKKGDGSLESPFIVE